MKHLPDYPANERTRYKVRIETEEGVVWLKTNMTLEDAQRAYIRERDARGVGASQWGSGHVFDEAGQHLARISYNGRLWPPLGWSRDMEPYAEAPRIEE